MSGRGRLAALLALVVAVAALALPAGASAHPLGNFTVNRYLGVELAGEDAFVRYVLDLAEIPSVQLGDRVRRPDFAAEIARGVTLTVDGRRARLQLLERRVTARPGAGGLETLRFEAVFDAGLAGTLLSVTDRNLAGRIGWREITVSARDGARLVSSSVPARSESDALRAYPADLLRSPLDVRSASATADPGEGVGTPPLLGESAAPARRGGGFEELVSKGDLSLGVVLVSLLVAAFWGAAHALTPGHGKALVAGYLIGTRGRPRDAVLLGATVTVTHTAGVFALGLVTLGLSAFVVPETLYPWLTLTSGLLVVAVGAGVLRSRFRGRRSHSQPHPHPHEHGHDHHHHDHHAPGVRGVVGVGVAAGLLPCPSALVVLLSAIALHRVGFGIVLIVAFSLGLAATITAIGLLAVLARSAFSRLRLDGRVVRALPAVSAAAIVVAGLAITLRALPQVV